MKTTIVLQPAIKTMHVVVRLNRQDITNLSFRLKSDILLGDCFIDSKSYEINFGSSLAGAWRLYKLPVFLSSLELHYDLTLKPDSHGVVVLRDQDGWLPVWPDADTIREFDIRFPVDEQLISNYEVKRKQTEAGFEHLQLFGQGEFELVIGRLKKVVHYGHSYYLHSAIDANLFDKFLRETKAEAERDWGKSKLWPERFVEVGTELSKQMINVASEELRVFSQMPMVLERVLSLAYPVQFGEYFKQFHQPFFRYLAWRALRGVMSDAEQAQQIQTLKSGHGPLVESDPGIAGVAFFKALEDSVGRLVFEARIREIMNQFRTKPMSLVHFINIFGQEDATRELLEQWLFMGH